MPQQHPSSPLILSRGSIHHASARAWRRRGGGRRCVFVSRVGERSDGGTSTSICHRASRLACEQLHRYAAALPALTPQSYELTDRRSSTSGRSRGKALSATMRRLRNTSGPERCAWRRIYAATGCACCAPRRVMYPQQQNQNRCVHPVALASDIASRLHAGRRRGERGVHPDGAQERLLSAYRDEPVRRRRHSPRLGRRAVFCFQ